MNQLSEMVSNLFTAIGFLVIGFSALCVITTSIALIVSIIKKVLNKEENK